MARKYLKETYQARFFLYRAVIDTFLKPSWQGNIRRVDATTVKTTRGHYKIEIHPDSEKFYILLHYGTLEPTYMILIGDLPPLIVRDKVEADALQEQWITTSQLAEAWDVSTQRIRYLQKSGRLEGGRLVGSFYVYPLSLAKNRPPHRKAGRPREKTYISLPKIGA